MFTNHFDWHRGLSGAKSLVGVELLWGTAWTPIGSGELSIESMIQTAWGTLREYVTCVKWQGIMSQHSHDTSTLHLDLLAEKLPATFLHRGVLGSRGLLRVVPTVWRRLLWLGGISARWVDSVKRFYGNYFKVMLLSSLNPITMFTTGLMIAQYLLLMPKRIILNIFLKGEQKYIDYYVMEQNKWLLVRTQQKTRVRRYWTFGLTGRVNCWTGCGVSPQECPAEPQSQLGPPHPRRRLQMTGTK